MKFQSLLTISFLITFLALASPFNLTDGWAGTEPPQEVTEVQSDLITHLRKKLESKVIVFLGPPGAGKGTQAKALSKLLGFPHISTGDLFRAEVKAGTEFGLQIKAYMDRGTFAPDSLTNEVIFNRLASDDCKNGFILDGFPRTLDQADVLDGMLKRLNKQVDVVIQLKVPDQTLLERLSGRRVCAGCGTSYHVTYSQPKTQGICDQCGMEVIQRSDDREEVIRKRIEVFDRETLPLVDHFFKQDRLYAVSGVAPRPEEVTSGILNHLKLAVEGFATEPTPYEVLEKEIKNPKYQNDELALNSLIQKFRDDSLEQNKFKRTGNTRRFIYALTRNLSKYQEYVKYFDQFGVEVLRAPDGSSEERTDEKSSLWPKDTNPAYIQALLSVGTKNLVPVAVLRETSNLYKPGTLTFSSLRNGVNADNISILQASWKNPKGEFLTREYRHVTPGKIDLSKRKKLHTDVFGWDDIFVVSATGKTYNELRNLGLKQSSREMVLSAFTQDRIYYKKPRDLKFNPQDYQRSIDFDRSSSEFVNKNPYFNLPLVQESGYSHILQHVLNEGIFFKAPLNRRQANYWQPGLNAGLPFVAKSDEIHEMTFMAHDLGHFSIRDLIYIGNDSPLHRQTYIAYRMMSEAFTLVLADMFLIDALKRSGVDYDFSKRKIYPLFQDLGLPFSDPNHRIENLKTIIKANVNYVLKGDDSLFRSLLQTSGKGLDSLLAFEEKYKPFFVEDYRWTAQNYDNMTQNSDSIRRWWKSIEPIRTEHGIEFESIDDFLSTAQFRSDLDLVDQMFEILFERNLRPLLENPVQPHSEQVRLKNAFLRYMAGQLGVFSKFQTLPQTEKTLNRILTLIHESTSSEAASLDSVKIREIRGVYEGYLHLLASKNLISLDDVQTYKETYPLFDAFYVSYDKNAKEYEDLPEVYRRVLSPNAYRECQLKSISQYLGRNLTVKEEKYTHRMISLVELSGGKVDQGLFVVEPGIALLSQTQFNDLSDPLPSLLSHSQVLAEATEVTFLLAGISAETAMEFVAHGEANVARLTTSKTLAMNSPLYRVQGQSPEIQKLYTQKLLQFRAQFEDLFQPRKSWESGNELYNITNAGNKATALTFTMTLADYHKLFLGRLSQDGNEEEVREVASKMCQKLNHLYPGIILTPEEYISLGNGAKYLGTQPFDAWISKEAPSPAFFLAGETQLTPEAEKVFSELNIDRTRPEAEQLAEFRSRLTYLSFLDHPSAGGEYFRKMVQDLGHLSIVSATRVHVILSGISEPLALELKAKSGTLGGWGSVLVRSPEVNSEAPPVTFLLSLNLKSWKKLLNDLRVRTETSDEMDHFVRDLSQLLHSRFPLIIPE